MSYRLAHDDVNNFVKDFKNFDDLNDKTFDPHPTEYPVVELEYPNTGASERCVYFCQVAVLGSNQPITLHVF